MARRVSMIMVVLMAVLMRLVVMRVTMIMFVTVLVVVLMFHRVQIPLMLECLHAPQPREKNARP